VSRPQASLPDAPISTVAIEKNAERWDTDSHAVKQIPMGARGAYTLRAEPRHLASKTSDSRERVHRHHSSRVSGLDWLSP
jgi:hypothetical protein